MTYSQPAYERYANASPEVQSLGGYVNAWAYYRAVNNKINVVRLSFIPILIFSVAEG